MIGHFRGWWYKKNTRYATVCPTYTIRHGQVVAVVNWHMGGFSVKRDSICFRPTSHDCMNMH